MAGSKFLLTLKMTTQGDVKGSSTKREGDLDYSKGIECFGFKYSVLIPFDSQSGLPTGQRKHSPITITKEKDSSSPKLL